MEQSYITFKGSEVSDPEILGRVPDAYRHLLNHINGFVMFDGGLHVRGAVLSPDWHSLRNIWSGDLVLHRLYPALRETDVPFAQDCLGDQFILRDEVVHRLSAETGELESLGMSLDTFLGKAQGNPVEFLSLHPLLQFMAEGGRLEPGQLLNAYPPFCMKESGKGVSLKAVPVFEQLRFLADFAKQIVELPEGAEIRIKVINVPNGEI
jgi:hypothetical protein